MTRVVRGRGRRRLGNVYNIEGARDAAENFCMGTIASGYSRDWCTNGRKYGVDERSAGGRRAEV
jgi:hypothetical protein